MRDNLAISLVPIALFLSLLAAGVAYSLARWIEQEKAAISGEYNPIQTRASRRRAFIWSWVFALAFWIIGGPIAVVFLRNTHETLTGLLEQIPVDFTHSLHA
jgi:hypothetical protein